jgi:hypothetical protein
MLMGSKDGEKDKSAFQKQHDATGSKVKGKMLQEMENTVRPT